MAFKVGQLVVFLPDDGGSRRDAKKYGVRMPLVGCVYTVRDIDTRYIQSDGMAGLRLEEIINPKVAHSFGMAEAAYRIERFRPVAPTSIEIFRALVKNPRVKDPTHAQ